ncbi:MAG: hypothetical protein K6G27_10620 [Lachnospiraceae bacterium]|nr:hypothetical protein [Lachnospiraceae bacterium]
MISTKTEIDIEFKKAMEQADELEELSCTLCNISNIKIERALTLLTRSWKGQNAMDYLKNTKVLKDRLFDSAEILKDTAEMIRRTASVIYTAEMAAVSICNTRW